MLPLIVDAQLLCALNNLCKRVDHGVLGVLEDFFGEAEGLFATAAAVLAVLAVAVGHGLGPAVGGRRGHLCAVVVDAGDGRRRRRCAGLGWVAARRAAGGAALAAGIAA